MLSAKRTKCSGRRVLTSYHSTTTPYLSLELLNELHVNKKDVIFCIVYLIMKKPPKQDLLFSAPRHWEQTDEVGELATVASWPCDRQFDHSTYRHHLTLPISKRRGFMRGSEFQFQLNFVPEKKPSKRACISRKAGRAG